MARKDFFILLSIFSLISCNSNREIIKNRFEAENAFLYCHPNNANFEWNIQATENNNASNERAVEYIRKGDSIIWGLNLNEDTNADLSLCLSYPLKWQTSEGPSPVDFVFDNIYELTLNNSKISFSELNVFKGDAKENIYNYNYWINLDTSINLNKGDNIIKLTKIIGNNEYASTGNVDYIDISCSSLVKAFLPNINPDIDSNDGELVLNDDTFIKNEPILVKANPIKGIQNQVVALYQKNASLFVDKPLFKFNVNQYKNKFENILLHPYNEDIILGTGIYKVVLMDELTSASYYTVYIEVIEEHI